MTQTDADLKIMTEVRKRFRECEDWESYARNLYEDDIKFANADSDNMFQWPMDISGARLQDKRPCLTINKTRIHNLQIINDAKQNKPAISIRPVGGDASYDAAQVYQSIIRHIEYISSAEQVYDSATMTQVQGGIGYWRVLTDYMSPDTFDQEVYIRRIPDPRSVYLDPDIKEVNGSDARFGFIFDNVPRDKFDQENPEYTDIGGESVIGNSGDAAWLNQNHVRVCEYYRRSQKKDKLVTFINPYTGEQVIGRWSKLDEEGKSIWKQVKDEKTSRIRDIVEDVIQWYKIAGDCIVDRRDWPGKYIPIVRLLGEETVIDGIMDRKGHTRAMKDPQRLYNYWSSNAAEFGALQSKSPYMAPTRAIEGHEEYWKTANQKNHSFLPYNDMGEDGQPIAAPTRQGPPVMSPGYAQGMQIAQNEMMMASGQYQSQFGQNENATSGKAINERQRQGDNATYHFVDNLAVAIRFTGQIVLDLVPKIYDTPRIMLIMAEDGTEQEINIDPEAAQAYEKISADHEKKVRSIFNPNVGMYDIQSDVGPSYSTLRQEAWNAFSQIAAHNPQFMQIAGDLMFRSADFPLADEIAKRFKNIIPPNVLGIGLPPQIEQAMDAATQHITQLQQQMTQLQQQLTDRTHEMEIKQQDSDIKAFQAMGDPDSTIDPEMMAPLVHEIVAKLFDDLQAQGVDFSRLTGSTPAGAGAEGPQPAPQATSPGIPDAQQQPEAPAMPDQSQVQPPADNQGAPPMEGARQASDGNWYIPDPTNPGKFLMVTPDGQPAP